MAHKACHTDALANAPLKTQVGAKTAKHACPGRGGAERGEAKLEEREVVADACRRMEGRREWQAVYVRCSAGQSELSAGTGNEDA